MKKIIILTLSSVLFSLSTFAQKAQNELVITGGIGYSLTTTLVKGVINTSLKASGFQPVKEIPLLNAQLDFAIAENFSIGAAYSFNKFSTEETKTINDTIYNANVSLSRQNIGIRPLFHFGADETLDMYVGGRFGFSTWKGEYSILNNYGDNRANEAKTPNAFTVQVLFGARKYFNDFIGINFEVGLGTAPYFVGGGLSFKIG